MTGYHDLSEFESGVTVGARGMGPSISEVAMRSGLSRVHLEYRESGKTSNLRYRCGREKILQERDQRRLQRIVQRDRRAVLPQIAADFKAVPSTSVSVRTIQRNIGLSEPMAHSCTLADNIHKALRLARTCQHRHWTVDDWKHVA